MATLSEYKSGPTVSLKRGTTNRSLGAKPIVATTAPTAKGNLPGIVQKTADIGKQIGDVVGMVAGKTAGFLKNSAVDIVKDAALAAKSVGRVENLEATQYNRMATQLSQKQDELVQAYKSGKMSKENYSKALQDISTAFSEISKQNSMILQGPSLAQRELALLNTAATVLSLGSFSTGKALGKPAVEGLVSKLENAVTKVPAVRALAERNAQKIIRTAADESFEQLLTREGKNVALGLLIKRPIFYQSNIQGGKDVYDKVLAGNYGGAVKSAAWLGTQMLEGGPIGAFMKGTSWLKSGLGKLSYGTDSFIDGISKQIGNKNPAQIARFLTTLEKKAPEEFDEASRIFRILQETNLQAVDNDVNRAVDNVMTHYQQHGMNLENLTPSQLYKDFRNWSQADELAQKTLRSGLVEGVKPEDASRYVVVRWDTPTKEGVADAVLAAGPDRQAQLDALYELADRPGVGWGNNEILRQRLEDIIVNSETAEEAAEGIRKISTASTILKEVPKKVAKELSDLGYSIAAPFGGRTTPIVEETDLRKLVTGAIKGNDEVFDVSRAPEPNLAAIVGAIDRAGLSPRSTNTIANRKLQESLVANLDELGVGREIGLTSTADGDVLKGGKAILGKLQQYVENKKPALGFGRAAAITDIRQMRIGEIQEVLNVSKSQAKTISSAIMDAYMQVPLEFRGLGDKIVDGLYKFNPLQKYYSRLQSALRYTYNPFFRTQERVETKLLSHAQAGNLIWGESRAVLDAAAKKLDEAGIFTSSLPGEAAQDQVFGRITANITAGQKRDLAGLAMDMAKVRGITLDEMVNQHSDELDDALRVVVQYPRKGLLASPLARTLNLAFFPVRYNAKVTTLAAKTLAKQPPNVQLAVIHSLFNLRDWLKSDEGIKWQANHSDAIQLFNWLTPINSIQSTFNMLGHKPDSMSDLGQLGGLPLGLITQILDGQGIIRLNTPYVNPKTGDVIPDYIPKTTQARAATALTDLLSTTFTYPGRILGLPGKEATLKKVVAAFIDTNGTDFDKNVDLERLTPLQQNWVRVLKGDTSKDAIDALYNSPLPDGYKGYTLPPLDLPFQITPPAASKRPTVTRRQGLPTKAATKTKEKKLAVPINQ